MTKNLQKSEETSYVIAAQRVSALLLGCFEAERPGK
jgi:hypothetical protein